MKKHLLTSLLLLASLAGCTNYGSHGEMKKMEEIKHLGDSNPRMALSSYDSLKKDITKAPTYVRNKYALLGVRLRDKADIMYTSDSCITPLIPYFEKNGTNRERQEVYYYAGSVYRDLQDAPRSLEYFLKSASCAENGKVDSVMLRNCYSQLYKAYTIVQDYKNALETAKAEYQVAQDIGILDEITMIHLGNAFMRTDSFPQATKVMLMTEKENRKHTTVNTPDILCDMLYYFSLIKDTLNARLCYTRFANMAEHPLKAQQHISLGKYFALVGPSDSCTHHFQLALEKGDLICKYDACKKLFHLYESTKNQEQAYKYANEFFDICANLDLGKRQEMAATVNNQHQYYRNKREEERIKKEKEKKNTWLWGFCLSVPILIFFSIYKNFQFKKQLQKISDTLGGSTGDRKKKKKETQMLKQIQKDAETAKARQEEMERELKKAQSNARLQKELREKQAREKERLEKDMEQTRKNAEETLQEAQKLIEHNTNLLRMTRLTELTKSEENIAETIRKASLGKQTLTAKQWDELYSFIDQQCPEFASHLSANFGTPNETQTRTCYLLKLGLTSTEICNLVEGCSRSTIWRWKKRLKLEEYPPTEDSRGYGKARPNS